MTTSKIAQREKLKARIPKIVRQESWRYKRIKESWRKPMGITSKMRRRQRGWPKIVSVGYKTPEDLRHLHPSGLREIMVYRSADLDKVDPKTCAARISHTVGEKKRVAILDRARELEVKVLNPRIHRRPETPEEGTIVGERESATEEKSTETRELQSRSQPKTQEKINP